MKKSVREAKVEEELYHLIKTALKKHGGKIEKAEFQDIEPQYPVDGGRADLVLLLSDGKPLIVIECKRKVEAAKGWTAIRDFDPLGSRVINQALGYAVNVGAPIFATTNGETFAMFRAPEPGEPFKLDTHRLLIREISLVERDIEEILEFASQWFSRIPIRRIGVDWLFISRLRSFVNYLSNQFRSVIGKLERDKSFSKKRAEFEDKVGALTNEQLAREVAYLLMNKLVFYKILERHFGQLPKLKPIAAPDGASYIAFLNTYFEKVIEVTKDFEPVFVTDLYDEVPLPNIPYLFEEVNGFIEDMDTYKLEEIGSDVVGYIYEELLPDEERHALGQFYTPPPIAELIVKWTVTGPDDKIIDPAVGSGTFVVKAYKRLSELKLREQEERVRKRSPKALHKEILSQIYADDINPFPLQLTAMNLAMRDVRYPTSEMNLIAEDYFNLRPKQPVIVPYTIDAPR
ncbi:MAG: N-6 DNA methylase [Candidatus Thorarchaeota archaeon]